MSYQGSVISLTFEIFHVESFGHLFFFLRQTHLKTCHSVAFGCKSISERLDYFPRALTLLSTVSPILALISTSNHASVQKA